MTTSGEKGFRICGFISYIMNENNQLTKIFKDKYWGRKITIDNLTEAMALYFFNGKIILT